MYDVINEITFKISPYCNLDCEYCFQKYEVKTKTAFFDKYDQLLEFLKKLPIGPKLEIKLTGGETSLFPDQIRLAYKKLKKLERYKDTEVWFTTISNGTNMKALIELFDEGILDPWGSKISWDGIYSASKSRKPKNKNYNDYYFNKNIKLLGESKYADKVLVRTALTENTVDNLCESALYAFDVGCTKWEYYYLTDAEYYKDPIFIECFKYQIEDLKLAYGDNLLQIQNVDTFLYNKYLLDKNEENRLRSIACRHLGTSLYIDMDGNLYPCGFFSPDAVFDDSKLCIGNIYTGFYKDVLEDFCKEYSTAPMCNNNNTCNLYHCFECPAVSKYRNNHLQSKLMQACGLRYVEAKVFDDIIPSSHDLKRIGDSYDFVKTWKIKESLNQDLPFDGERIVKLAFEQFNKELDGYSNYIEENISDETKEIFKAIEKIRNSLISEGEM